MKKTANGKLIIILLIFTITVFNCAPSQKQAEAEKKETVFVTIPPLAYLVERIGGDKIHAEILLHPGSSPHSYEVTAAQMKTVLNSKMFFITGANLEFEKMWLERLSSLNPDIKIINTGKEIKHINFDYVKQIPEDEHAYYCTDPSHHHHHHGKDYIHEGADPHIWLSPLNAVLMAEEIYAALNELLPDSEIYFKANYDALIKDLKELHNDLKEEFADIPQKKFIVFHPAWGYFADAYGLTQIVIEYEGKEPSPFYLAQIIKIAKEENIKTVFASPHFSSRSASAIALEIKGNVRSLDPVAYNYIENLRDVKEALKND